MVELVSDQVGSAAAQVLMSMTQNGMKRAPFYATNGIGVRGKFTLHLASRHVQDLDVAVVTARGQKGIVFRPVFGGQRRAHAKDKWRVAQVGHDATH